MSDDTDFVADDVVPEHDATASAELSDISTGVGVIDEALDSLKDLDAVDITQHPQAYDAIHGVLREALAHAGRPEDAPVDP